MTAIKEIKTLLADTLDLIKKAESEGNQREVYKLEKRLEALLVTLKLVEGN